MKILSNTQIASYYDEFSQRLLRDYVRGNPRVAAAIEFVLNCCSGEERRLLDVGCGIGNSSQVFASAFPEVQVWGVDISPKNIETASRLFETEQLSFAVADLSEVPDGGPFDLIAMLDVYEHIPLDARDRLHQTLSQSLAPSGKVALTIPSKYHQDYLHEHKPEGLQIVDETILLDDLQRLANDLNATITQYRHTDVWQTNDYVHVLMERAPRYEKRRSAPRARTPIRRRIASRLFPGRERKRARQSRMQIVRERLGIDIVE